MAGSNPEDKPWILEQILKISPKTILDIGPGMGNYSRLVQDIRDSITLDAVEVWQPYVEQFNLTSLYDNVTIADVREHDNFNYDIVIFGDILEHMTKEEALEVWDKASKQARYAIISIPIIHYPQGAHEGNPYEVHVKDDWSVREVLSSFSHIETHKAFRVCGAFIANFK